MAKLWLSISKPERVDGLCPLCFFPSVVRLESKIWELSGVRVRQHFRCRDCGRVEGIAT